MKASPRGLLPPGQTDGCTLVNEVYRCNLPSLERALHQAKTIGVETQQLDRSTATQLRELVHQLGKGSAVADQPADLVFALTPVAPTGVNFGPGDHDLATLRVYAPAPEGGHGALLWAETLHGQGDRPWPAQVHALIEQFRDRLSAK